jgi:cell division protein FtsB
MDCFVAVAPLRKRFAFVAGNDAERADPRYDNPHLRIPLTRPSHLGRMVSRARLKSILTGLALYTMAAAMVGYFGVNAYTGKYGLNARQELDQEIIALTSELARLKRERAQGEQRVSLLRSDRVDPDMLDERARFQLDYANPRDLVRTIKPN